MNRSSKIKMVSTVTLENFPSRTEVLTILDTFLSDSNYPKNYNIGTKDNSLQIIFKSPDVAFDFVKRMNIEKISNHIYNKLRTNLTMEPSHSEYSGMNGRIRLKRVNMNHSGSLKSYEKPIERKSLRKSASTGVKCSIQASEPYTEQYQERKKEVIANRNKWIVNRNFYSYIGKATFSKRNNLDCGTVIDKPNFYKVEFRSNDKSKWISKKNFFV